MQTLPVLVDRISGPDTDRQDHCCVIYIQGGTHSIRLTQLAAQFWNWFHTGTIGPTASYLPGHENLSRDKIPSAWMMHPEVMNRVLEIFGPLQIPSRSIGALPRIRLPAHSHISTRPPQGARGLSVVSADSTMVAQEVVVAEPVGPLDGPSSNPRLART